MWRKAYSLASLLLVSIIVQQGAVGTQQPPRKCKCNGNYEEAELAAVVDKSNNDADHLHQRLPDHVSEPRSSSIGEALSVCDNALLMGAPVLDNLLTKLASQLQHASTIEQEDHHQHSLSTRKHAADGDSVKAKDQDSVKAEFFNGVLEQHGTWRRLPSSLNDHIAQLIVSPLLGTVSHESDLSIHDFDCQYLRTAKPVVIHGCMQSWPALRNWNSPAYLKVRCSSSTVFSDLLLSVCGWKAHSADRTR